MGSSLDGDLRFLISILISVIVGEIKSVSDMVLIGVVSYTNGSDIFSFLQFNNIVLRRVVILVVNNLKNHRM